MTDETMPTNVIAALARVTAEIGGIAKKRSDQSGPGNLKFPFRGIDAICTAAQPLLGAYGLTIVPTESAITSVQEFTMGGNPWTDTFVDVLWTIYGPGGVTDAITAKTQGQGRDNSDKGYNKAMTMAFKNVVLRVLCIGDPKDDADEFQDNIRDAAPTPADLAARTFEAVKALGSDRAKAFVRYVGEQVADTPKVSFAAMEFDPWWQATVSRMLTEWTKHNPADTATVQTDETPGDVNVEPDSPPVALEPSLRQRVDALPQPMKKRLNEDCKTEGIKNMLMPRKADEPFIAAWLDRYDAEVLEAAELEMATGEVNDVGGSFPE